ncbi:hypothetical protein [Phaffia rhodozyma]|uniref:Uncharacterized protein n=1 Tax=Phaffia rhodozyma TaxID=264483 RepID=A0A0F7SK90_PHARH|nr:hypothetical protein [Phaffia rhodozyma]
MDNQTDCSPCLPPKTIDPDSIYSPLHSLANKFSTLPSSSSSSNIGSDYQSPAFDTLSGFAPLDMFAASPKPDNYSDNDDYEAEKLKDYEEEATVRIRQRKQEAHADEEDDHQKRFTIGSVKVHTPSICENEKGATLRDSYFDGSNVENPGYAHSQKPTFSRPSHGQVFGPQLRKFDESPPWETDKTSLSPSLAPLSPLGSSLIFSRMKPSRSPSSSESDPSSPSTELANVSIRTTPQSLRVITPDGVTHPSPSFLQGVSSPETPLETLISGRKDKDKTRLKGGIGGLWKGFGGRIRGKKGEESNTDGLGFDFDSTSTPGSRVSDNRPTEGEVRGEIAVENVVEETRTDQNVDETSNTKQTLLLSPVAFTSTLRSPLSPSSPLTYTQVAHNLPRPSPVFSTSGPPSPSSPNRRPNGLYSPGGSIAGPSAYTSYSALSSPGGSASIRTGLEANLGPNGCPIGTLQGGFKLIPLDEALKRKNALNQMSSRENLRDDRPNRTASVGGSLRKLFGGNARGETDREDAEGGQSAAEGETEGRGLTPSSSTGSFARSSFSFVSSPVKREILRVDNRQDGDDTGWNQPSLSEEDTPRLPGSPKLRIMCSMGSLVEQDQASDDDDDDPGWRRDDGWAEVRRLKIEHARERAAWKKKTADYQNQIQMLQRLLKEATERDSDNPPMTPV